MDHVGNTYNIHALKEGETELCTLAGPTCSSADVLKTDFPLPKLEIGDLLLTPHIGAYSYTLATNFNSVTRPSIAIVDSSISL